MLNSETFYEWAFEDVCMGVGGIKSGSWVLSEPLLCVCVAFTQIPTFDSSTIFFLYSYS